MNKVNANCTGNAKKKPISADGLLYACYEELLHRYKQFLRDILKVCFK